MNVLAQVTLKSDYPAVRLLAFSNILHFVKNLFLERFHESYDIDV